MRFLLIICLFLSLVTQASKLPNPLTLEDALTLAKKQNLDEKQPRINIKLNEIELKSYQNKKIIQVMQAFFDVVLADMRYQTILEQLALSAVIANRVQNDFDTQNASEVELLEKQALTQLDVSKRIDGEAQQIITRAKLAQLLNISYENRPDDLIKPDFMHIFKKALNEFEIWQKKIQTNNPQLGKLKRVLTDLKLAMPFGQNQKQKTADLLTKIKQQNLLIKQRFQYLNQQALSLWLKLKTLKQLNTALTTELNYRDLYLERARANYDMGIENDLGNAMSHLTETEWKLAKNEFDFVLTFIRLQQLAGEDYAL